jgi:hypothetical protein
MAFKARALAAAAVPALPGADTELFQRADMSRSDLATAR